VGGDDRKVDQEHLHNGSALNAVDAKGRLSVPAFIRAMIERRSPEKVIVLGKHEAESCLIGYDANYKRTVLADVNRRKLRDEEHNIDLRAHHARNRRAFGLTESCAWDSSGRIILPPMMRRVGGIEELVLFVGAGETFELWNPQRALESGDPDLAELAAYRLEERGVAP
jgi:MraZ protein